MFCKICKLRNRLVCVHGMKISCTYIRSVEGKDYPIEGDNVFPQNVECFYLLYKDPEKREYEIINLI